MFVDLIVFRASRERVIKQKGVWWVFVIVFSMDGQTRWINNVRKGCQKWKLSDLCAL